MSIFPYPIVKKLLKWGENAEKNRKRTANLDQTLDVSDFSL